MAKEKAPKAQGKKKEELIESSGTVVKVERGKFRVQLDDAPHEVLCHLGGKLQKNFIRVVQGDKVKVEISPYDFTRGRITFREK